MHIIIDTMKQLLHNIHMQTNEEMKMKAKYSCYEYEVFQKIVGQLLDGWVYKIYGEGCLPYDDGVIESDEWYETEQETIEAAHEHIDKLENGPDEPDYDAPTAEEMYQRAHDDRQKLRGY